MDKNEVIKLLEELNLDKEEYVILSSGSALMRGIYQKCGDIDLAISDKAFEYLKEKYNLIPKDNNWYTVTDKIECVVGDNPKKEKVGDYYLQDILEYYEFVKSRNRDKDKERIKILERYIYYKDNVQDRYKLIEERNHNYERFPLYDSSISFDEFRSNLLESEINTILSSCKDKEVYILGHNNPDADSIVSSYVLTNILKSMGIKAHFCILDKNYDYTFHDKKLLEEKFPYEPEIVNSKDKYFILVDHNDLQGLNKEQVLGAFDHHVIKYEIDNIVEIEYSSTSLLIYDLFKDKYNFSEEEKYLIALATLSDSDYLTSSRFTEEDRRLFNELDLKEDVKELQRKYFITTDFSLGVDKNFEINKKEYLRNNKKITRIQITSYDDIYLDEYINKAKELDYLLIWVNYEDNTTTIYYEDRVIHLDYLLSSTYLVFELLEKEKEKTRVRSK